MQIVDCATMKKFAPKRFNKYVFAPSQDTAGGILVGWMDSTFEGVVEETRSFAITISFRSRQNVEKWKLTSVYGQCTEEARDQFVQWIYHSKIDQEEHFMIIRDFNFYRSLDNRNRSGGNLNNINIFNAIISNLGLLEIPLKGRKYIWTNMKDNLLLEQLDWSFTSLGWTLKYQNTRVMPMAKPTSDHFPYVAQIGTSIPKAQTFRFETFLIHQPGFMDLVPSTWSIPTKTTNSAARIAAKFKLLRKVLKRWSKGISKLTILIKKYNDILLIIDKLEE